MKNAVSLAGAVLFLALVSLCRAGTFHLPKDEPIATVQIPSNWQIDEQEEFVQATAPDQGCHVLVWTVEDSKTAESAGEAIRYIKRNGTVSVKSDAAHREKSKFKGQDMTIVWWDASEADHPITIRCSVVPVGQRKWILFIVWGDKAEEEKHRKELDGILQTIEPSTRPGIDEG